MTKRASTWRCRRVKDGCVCATVNPARLRKCQVCAKPRPARKRPAHMAALDHLYETYAALNGGEHCGICGATQKTGGPRLHRDHDHRLGTPRGLLCFRCNAALRPYMTLEWVEAAAAYLRRTEATT